MEINRVTWKRNGVRAEIYTQLGKGLQDDEELAMETSGVKQVKGTARAKALQWERVGQVWGAERRVARVLGGRGSCRARGGGVRGCPPGALLRTHALSTSCSRSWTLRLSSSAGGKLLPTFMKRAAILLLRRKPAARRRSPCRTHASTAAVGHTRQLALPCPHSPAPSPAGASVMQQRLGERGGAPRNHKFVTAS